MISVPWLSDIITRARCENRHSATEPSSQPMTSSVPFGESSAAVMRLPSPGSRSGSPSGLPPYTRAIPSASPVTTRGPDDVNALAITRSESKA